MNYTNEGKKGYAVRIICVVGTRPNFNKMAALYREFGNRKSIEPILVHTGQHYDYNMSQIFFEDLGLPKPDIDLEVCGGSNTYQTAQIMLKFEPILSDYSPDLVVVVGDVNSTLAAALVAAKERIPVTHVEAGLRSGDRDMPEEINRILVDHISDLMFVTEQSGLDNLIREGIPQGKIYFVGNVMVDTLLHNIEKATQTNILQRLGITANEYVLVTLHRPSNVDNDSVLKNIMHALKEISTYKKVVLPIHPRTKKNIERFGLLEMIGTGSELLMIEPLGYLEFLNAMNHAYAVITDSGELEETTMLGVPCLTVRNNTERPVTVQYGTNVLVGTDSKNIIRAFINISNSSMRKQQRPPMWDGNTASRIVDVLVCKYS